MRLDGLTVRAATAPDLDAVVELYRHLQPRDPELPRDGASAVWRSLLDHPGLTVFVGETSAGELVASCTLVVVPNLTRGGSPYGLIENVVTHAGHRQRGYGRRILHAAVAAAWEVGCYKVMLLTGSKKPETLRFYADAGFEQSKTGFQVRRPGF